MYILNVFALLFLLVVGAFIISVPLGAISLFIEYIKSEKDNQEVERVKQKQEAERVQEDPHITYINHIEQYLNEGSTYTAYNMYQQVIKDYFHYYSMTQGKYISDSEFKQIITDRTIELFETYYPRDLYLIDLYCDDNKIDKAVNLFIGTFDLTCKKPLDNMLIPGYYRTIINAYRRCGKYEEMGTFCKYIGSTDGMIEAYQLIQQRNKATEERNTLVTTANEFFTR